MLAAQDFVDRSMPAANVRVRRALGRSLSSRRFLPPIRPDGSQDLLKIPPQLLWTTNLRLAQYGKRCVDADHAQATCQIAHHISNNSFVETVFGSRSAP